MTVPRRTIAVLIAASMIPLAGCGGGDGGSSGTSAPTEKSAKPTPETARKAQVRLDGRLIDAWTLSQEVSARPYACLNKAPRGGPVLATCVSTCQACSISFAKIKRRVAKAYDAAPRDVRRIYHATYLAQMRNLDDHRAAVSALGEYARVHGASSYAGMAEFSRAKALIKAEDRSAKVWQRRIRDARKRFDRYLETL